MGHVAVRRSAQMTAETHSKPMVPRPESTAVHDSLGIRRAQASPVMACRAAPQAVAGVDAQHHRAARIRSKPTAPHPVPMAAHDLLKVRRAQVLHAMACRAVPQAVEEGDV